MMLGYHTMCLYIKDILHMLWKLNCSTNDEAQAIIIFFVKLDDKSKLFVSNFAQLTIMFSSILQVSF